MNEFKMNMKITNPAINEYIDTHANEEKEHLKELDRETHLSYLAPIMLSGNSQGQFLRMISHLVYPKTILEIGTYTGYSGICLAEGLQKDGKIITIDKNEELEDVVNEYFEKAGLKEQLEMHIGDATSIIPDLDVEFDLVFIDADKGNYPNYYSAVIDKVRSGGMILADNVLWSAKVLDENKDPDTQALDDFNKMVANDSRVENVIIPLRDGIHVIRKK